jgi:hypothetical protein
MSTQNDLDTATGQRERKAFATLAAQYALAGMELVKGDWEVTGQALYYATRWGLWKPLDSLDAAREYLAKVTHAARHGEELQAQ